MSDILLIYSFYITKILKIIQTKSKYYILYLSTRGGSRIVFFDKHFWRIAPSKREEFFKFKY